MKSTLGPLRIATSATPPRRCDPFPRESGLHVCNWTVFEG